MHLTKTADSRGLHFPLFRRRWHCSTWTHRKLCWTPQQYKPQKSKVIPVLYIIKDMGKEEITSAKYRHNCHSIFTLKKMLKAIKHAVSETEHAMGVWCPTCLLHNVKEILEGPKYETAFHTVFRAACRWTVVKGSKHLDPWMLAITNKEPFTAEIHHYRSCYHTYWVRSVTSWV